MQSEAGKELIKQGTKAKYGTEYYYQSDSFKQKMLDKYGATSFMKSPIGVKKYLESMNKIYGYSSYVGKNLTDTQKLLLNDPEYLRLQHHDNKRNMVDIARELGVSDGTINNKLDYFGIEQKYYFGSMEEQEIKDFIISLGFKIEENNRTIIYKELDIYIPSKSIAIEYCGLYWHSDGGDKHPNYHMDKLNRCINKGIKLVTIFQDEWLHKRHLVERDLRKILGVSNESKVWSCDHKVKTISLEDKSLFFEKTDIDGDASSSINYGLVDDNDNLLACMGFIKLFDDSYKITRYSADCNVIGGFNKLLYHFVGTFKPKKLSLSVDRRWYKIDNSDLGIFKLDKITLPDYDYILADKRFDKFNFSKHRLQKFSRYDPNLSIEDNMKLLHIYKIYNCGYSVYIMNF